jgi:hypothetical protein
VTNQRREATLSVRERLAYLFATPRWRLAWFIGAIAWCAVLNVVFISGGGTAQWIGLVSVVPIVAFAIDTLIRSYRLDHPKEEK